MAELVDDSVPRRCAERTQHSVGAANEFANRPRTIHRFCGKACGQARVGARGSACFRAPHWIARVLSSEPLWMPALWRITTQQTVRRAIVVR